jgi:hypothetical protein
MLGGAAFFATQAGQLGLPASHNLMLGMTFSAAITVPTLWSEDGLLVDAGLPGPGRAMLALLLPLVCLSIGTPFGLDAFADPPIAAG